MELSDHALWDGRIATGLLLATGLIVAPAYPSHAGDAPHYPSDHFLISGAAYDHAGAGVFVSRTAGGQAATGAPARRIDLKQIEHAYDPRLNSDVPYYTNVTLPGMNPPFRDEHGRAYALITLYNVDPPLEDLPSKEAGVDRGMDFRDPSNAVKAAYSNYVSPVFTNDRERRPVPGHPIGHFYVQAQIPGYPTILAGMTTIARADDELVDLTLGRQLGLGGVLLTRQPGRLNSSAEAMSELDLRQRELIVIDGVNYRREGGRNVGPVFLIEDGNVTFARFKLPVANAEDALNAFLEFLDRGLHNHFGSLLSRPYRGTGAGCAAFAMLWLKASGVIPVVDEAELAGLPSAEPGPFWTRFYNRITLPWDHIGCDDRVGLRGRPRSARYTVHDELFHGLTTEAIVAASEGLAARIREDSGTVVGTLFSFGVLTPLRDLVVAAKRNDPWDRGNYDWAAPGEGLDVGFWDNGRFSDWVKSLWQPGIAPDDLENEGLQLVRQGRFYGVEVDAMATPRISADFYAEAKELIRRRTDLAARGVLPTSCRAVFLEQGLE